MKGENYALTKMSQTCDILRFERRMKDDSTYKERNGKINQSSSK